LHTLVNNDYYTGVIKFNNQSMTDLEKYMFQISKLKKYIKNIVK